MPPEQVLAIKKDLEEVLSSLIERGIADDQNFPVLRQLSKQGWEVSFGGAQYISIALGDLEYSEVYRELSDKRSYTVKLIDGGLLQLMYQYVENELNRHRLVYYPSPNLRSFQDDPDAYLRDELFLEIVSRRIVPFPLRFDFDNTSAHDIGHPVCHLTLGDVKGCRIPFLPR